MLNRPETKRDFAALNARLRRQGIKPARSIADAHRIHLERVRARFASIKNSPTLAQRFQRRILKKYLPEIERRGGETLITESNGDVTLSLQDYEGGLYLLVASGWRQYSRSFGACRASLAYLCGTDDNGPWAVRVPGTLETVEDASFWITPKDVIRAENEGRQVLRQGDVYAIEMKRDRAKESASGLPSNHRWDPETRTLSHEAEPGERGHGPLQVPFPAKFLRQRVLEMGRSGRWGNGD